MIKFIKKICKAICNCLSTMGDGFATPSDERAKRK